MSSEPISTARFSVSTRLRSVAGSPLPSAVAWALSALLAAGIAYYHWRYEGPPETIAFAGAITTVLAASLMLLSRRVLFSLAIIAATLAVIVIVSDVKRRYIEMVLHAYDLVFYMTSFSTLSFLWVDHKNSLLALSGAAFAMAMVGRQLYRVDPTRAPRLVSAALILTCSGLALWASHAKGERRNTLFYWDNLYISSFYSSWSETLETLWRGQLIEALRTQSKPLFTLPATCEPAAKPPHVILIHQESVVPPSFFPSLGHDPALNSFFNSGDGKLHRLRVETYGAPPG